MVETITPVVHGGRTKSYLTTAALHLAGATTTGALFGGVLGVVGGLAGAPWGETGPVLLTLVAVVYVTREQVGVPVPVPARNRQVPDWWRTFYSPPVAALLYGAGLGVGFFTFVTFATYVVVCVGALLSGSWTLGAFVGGTFGFSRGAAAVVAGSTPSGDVVDHLEQLLQTRAPRLVNVAAMVAVATAAGLAVL